MIDPLKEIDWNEVWKAQMLRNRESNPGRDYNRIWETREMAERFWRMCLENRERQEKTIAETDFSPESRLLDIGAGPGTLAIPFASVVAHVTAVEPASGMASKLREMIEDQYIENISVVQKSWDEIDVEKDLQPPYDVVIASFSLGMTDIRAAIKKMKQASSKYIYLYHFASDTFWDVHWRELWPKLHDREYYPGPKCDILYNVLYQMGIYPDISVSPQILNQRFSSIEDALKTLRPQAQIETPEQDAIFRDFLKNNLKNDKGSLILPVWSNRVKMWWVGVPV
jgi:SAM-dependent methyltransferase